MIACADYSGGLDSGDTTEVVCEHPASQFEAQIDVVYPDYNGLEGVEFILEQGDFWTVWLQAPDDDNPYWHTRMQIYEFSCAEPFYYDFIEDA